MTIAPLEELAVRLRTVEDELAIRRVILSYGPAADAGLTARAASLWAEDGQYDWDGGQVPYEGRGAIKGMLDGATHQGLIGGGVAHFAGPPLIHLDGDRATALTYSLIMRREAEPGRFYLWRVSAARWDLERDGTSWAVRRRSNRLLDESGAGRLLLGETLDSIFDPEGRP
jgi:SnoaL-like domain